MTDRPRSREGGKMVLAEDLGDQSHALVDAEGGSVAAARRDAGTFLTAVLEGEEAVVGQEGRILVTEDGEDSALVLRTVIRHGGG